MGSLCRWMPVEQRDDHVHFRCDDMGALLSMLGDPGIAEADSLSSGDCLDAAIPRCSMHVRKMIVPRQAAV